jgi:Phage integrase, N-terminal
MHSHSLKPQHVEALVKRWREEVLAIATIKNRMAVIRWWARKLNRENVVERTNDKLHGLRHAYAQQRYLELTGWQSPAGGGPKSTTLAREQRAFDNEARLMLSRELGHEREAVTSI